MKEDVFPAGDFPLDSLVLGDQHDAASVILKLRGETCNIDCLYCYEKRKERPGGARLAVAEVRHLRDTFGRRPLAVELHGGEPLTAGPVAVADVLDALADMPHIVRVTLQTNGLLLSRAWLDLFDRHYPSIQIGISLDGDERGNAWRVGYDGRPTYEGVRTALNLLAERNRSAGVIAAVTPRLLGREVEVLDHLASFEAVNAVSFVPCFDTMVRQETATATRTIPASRLLQRSALGAGGPGWAIRPHEYAEYILNTANHWVASGLFRRMKLEPVVSTIRKLRGLPVQHCHFSAKKCKHVFTLYPGSRLTSCDELPNEGSGLGRITELADESDLVRRQAQLPIMSTLERLMAVCASCQYLESCGGGCLATRVRLDDEGQHHYCDHRARLIDGVACLLAEGKAGRCTSLHWRPRSPNEMSDVARFVRDWDSGVVDRSATFARSAYGNINRRGRPGIHDAADLTPSHPKWDLALERHVEPLVNAVIRQWRCVTYDSCEGHDYGDRPIPNSNLSNPKLPNSTLRVGILPRSRDEYLASARRLCRLARAVSGRLPDAVILEIGRADLHSVVESRPYPVLDIHLLQSPDVELRAYYAARGDAVGILVESILAQGDTAAADDSCGCVNDRRAVLTR